MFACRVLSGLMLVASPHLLQHLPAHRDVRDIADKAHFRPGHHSFAMS